MFEHDIKFVQCSFAASKYHRSGLSVLYVCVCPCGSIVMDRTIRSYGIALSELYVEHRTARAVRCDQTPRPAKPSSREM
jgi:hypothetical protein